MKNEKQLLLDQTLIMYLKLLNFNNKYIHKKNIFDKMGLIWAEPVSYGVG